ncbi:MAG: lysophospholipid acyltransferase family protein [Crocinitomicaceae bacterium]|jgi:Kdo2-lipid IVA lauroyltransferase/acyltransferase|nr:lysophospholipid acyltransferase family protein [Crocinitomicaceae bacterium]MDP4799003.1 lysophospholipid acyltransferase family protein [Crocinitomicaceae bacterium]MDP4805774.1 lysophospholipid acyltransferase family protein [Crocinitomicaceae bacterium]MDP4955646.1 lysophospholipid acyltransferase family protein [Crocinitomicaceae bacterium]MDP5042242.1 lysophospholipid acyltransferase family protein [Crocinitomicaceae bacterium]
MVARQIQFLSGALLYYGLVLPLSYLPLWLLYRLSGLLYFLFCTLLPYRKKVIDQNLQSAFPNATIDQRNQIRKDFYRYFSDLLVESVKNLTISKKQLLQRMQLENPEILEEIKALNKPILLVAGHYNNWEWLITAQALWFKQPCFGIGMPLSQPFWDHKLTQRRSRFGLKVVHANTYQSAFEATNPVVLVLADQAPSSATNCLWLPFLGQQSAVIFGPEYMANKYDCAVIYATVSNSKRGYYKVQLEVLVKDSKQLQYQELSQLHVQKLEQTILQKPGNWLWSHKRWKHKQPENWPQLSAALQQKFETTFSKHA